MSLTINTRLLGQGNTVHINRISESLFRSIEKLSSGLAINRASDNPAGLVVSEQLRSRVASLNQEIENTTNLIHKYQTASANVGEMRSQLTELRTMAVGAANAGGNSESSQSAWSMVGEHVVSQYNRTAELATYNGVNLLDGSEGSVASVSMLEGVDLSSAEAAEQSIAVIDEAMAELDAIQSEMGAIQKNELEARRSTLEITSQNLQAAESLLRDTDYAKEYANSIASVIQLRAAVAMTAHSYVQASSILSLLETRVL